MYFCDNEKHIMKNIYSQSLEWRKHWDADNLPEWDLPEIVKNYLPYGLSGFDKDGAPGKIIFIKIKIISLSSNITNFRFKLDCHNLRHYIETVYLSIITKLL